MNAATMQRKALREVGDNGRDTLWEISLPIATSGGTWLAAWIGGSTSALAYNASPATVQAALEARPNIGSGNVEVSGVPGGPYRVRLTGDLGALALPASSYPLTANGASLTAPATLAPQQLDEGAPQVLAGVCAELYEEYEAISNEGLRFLYIKRDLLQILLGESQKGIDVETAQKVEHLKDQHDNLLALWDRTVASINRLEAAGAAAALAAGSGPTIRTNTRRTPNGLAYGVLGFNNDNGRFS